MGTRTIRELSGLGATMPKTSFLLVLSSLAAMAFPSFSNFISEFTIIMAAISVNTLCAVAVLVPGIIAGYFMWMMMRIMPQRTEMFRRADAPPFKLLTLATFLVPLLVLGLYPAPLLARVIIPAVQPLRF